MQKISSRTTHAPAAEKTAKTFLWIAAGSAIGILLWIVGSILFQGFVTITESVYPVLPRGEKTVSLSEDGTADAVFVVNDGVRLSEMTARDILDFYRTDKTDWVLSGQDLDVTLFSPARDSRLAAALAGIIGKTEVSLDRGIEYLKSRQEVAATVARTPGAVGVLDTVAGLSLPPGARVIKFPGSAEPSVRFIVNADVPLTELTADIISDLIRGEKDTWSFAGKEAPVTLFSVEVKETLRGVGRIAARGRFLSSAVFTTSEEELLRSVGTTPGAIGFLPAAALAEAESAPGVKAVTVRSLALFASPDVFAIKDNRNLGFISETQFQDIFKGDIKNWMAVGGIDLTLVPVVFKPSTETGRAFNALYFPGAPDAPASALSVDSDRNLVETLVTIPGAVGYGNYFQLFSVPALRTVEVERREVFQNLTFNFLIEPPSKSSKAGGVSTIIINTIFMIILTVLFAAPLGIGAGVYFVEYARQGKLVSTLRFFTETLAGIPSIIYGLFGYILFRQILGLKEGLLSAGLTLTIMILPTIVRTTEEALKAVPRSYREESLALGATLWQTVRRVIIPAASPGILTGIILGVGRAIGETAAVLFTCGSSARSVLDQGINIEMFTKSARVLALHIYLLFREGGGNPRAFQYAFATSAILVIVILIINLLAAQLIRRINRMRKN
jgi:phosphate transport system permease protein